MISIHDSWLVPKRADKKLVCAIHQSFQETLQESRIMPVTPQLEKAEWRFRNRVSNDEISNDPKLNEEFYDPELQARYSEWLETGLQLGCIKIEME